MSDVEKTTSDIIFPTCDVVFGALQKILAYGFCASSMPMA